MSDRVYIDGYCPLVTCLKKGPHYHPKCSSCGAVNFGNLGCTSCQQARKASES